MSRRLAFRVLVMFCVFTQGLVTQYVCFVKIQWAAHLGQLHYTFLGIWCMHLSRYILYLNKFFKISQFKMQNNLRFVLTGVII